jgi:hypothetical protein
MENNDALRSCSRESREVREFREFRESEFGRGGVRLAEFELLFVDFQGLDPGLDGRWWNSKLGL